MKKIITLVLLISSFYATVSAQQEKYKLPEYQKFQLENGLTVYLMEKHDVPVISFSAIVPAGAIYDNNKAGIASLTAECLKCGTESYTKMQIEEAFDFVGASFNTYGAKEYAGISGKFAKKDQEKIFSILKELLVNPVFNSDEFEKEKKRTLVNLNQAKESPGSVINIYWDKFYYGNHVYGNISSGTISSVKPLTSEDLKTFYQTHYNPANSAIAVVGDFKSDEMKATVTQLFNDWKGGAATVSNLASKSVIIPLKPKVLLVNKEDARETTLIIGGPGVSRKNPDYVPILVVNTLFGGRFTSWINDELRIKSGLTYGAGSGFTTLQNDGTFIISTHTANETTEPTIAKAMEVINRLHSQGVDEETLTSAKNYMIGLFPPRYQTTDQLAGVLTNMFWYGYDKSYINNFEENVNTVTVDKATEIIKKYFPESNLQFVLIGKASDIKMIAAKYGTVTEVQIKDDIGKGFQ